VLLLFSASSLVYPSHQNAQNVTQTIPVKARLVTLAKEDGFSSSSSSSSLGATMSGGLYLAGPNSIWKLIPIPILQQINQLIREKDYEEALAMCEVLPATDSSRQDKVCVVVFVDRKVYGAIKCVHVAALTLVCPSRPIFTILGSQYQAPVRLSSIHAG
jgi:hypothetical protein